MTTIAQAVEGSHLVGYRNAVIAAIKDEFDELKAVEAHGGTFTEAQLKHYSMRAPSVLVAILGNDKVELMSTGEFQGPVMMAAYVIAEDRGKFESYDIAMAMAERIAGFMNANAFGYERAGPAMPRKIENLFSLDYEKKGVSIVALVWEANVRFGRDLYAGDIGDDYEGIVLEDLTIIEPSSDDEGLGL